MTGEHALTPQRLDRTSDAIRLHLRLAEGYKYLPDGHHTVSITSSDESVVSVPPFQLPDISFDWRVPVVVHGEGEAVLRVEATVFFCPVADESICLFNSCDIEQPVVVGEGGQVDIVHDIEPLA